MIVTITEDWFMELTAPRATKAAGVEAVARRYGIAARNVLAFGDGNNDVAMLSWAGLGVAMPHGRPAARQAADVVAPEGDPESALSRAVDELLDASPAQGHAAA
jgi:hydroxymethylpyrimidine pyrophosphatase-like HAD family hydrolase